MKRTKWPPERTAHLLLLVEQGLARREIATHMGADIHAVTAKLVRLKRVVPLAREVRGERARHAWAGGHPRFEDITSAEAATIRYGAPPSAPFARVLDRSLTGNAARLCAD